MTDKASVEASDKKRFEFVKGVVSNVEKRKVNSNKQTKTRCSRPHFGA